MTYIGGGGGNLPLPPWFHKGSVLWPIPIATPHIFIGIERWGVENSLIRGVGISDILICPPFDWNRVICLPKIGWDQSPPKRYDVKECALCVVYLKFKDCYSIDASADIHIAMHIAIHRYVCQLISVFCDRLKLCSAAAPDCRTGQNKGRYGKQERSFLLVSLVPTIPHIRSCAPLLILHSVRLIEKGRA